MRRVLQQLETRLAAFVEQRDDFVLVVACRDADCVYFVKTLDALDQGGTADLFWTFAHAFDDERSYVDAIVSDVAERRVAVNEALVAKGSAPWPELPSLVVAPFAPAAERLRELMVFARGLPPPLAERKSVWALLPVRVGDEAGLARLVAELARHDRLAPWFHHMRLVVRVGAGAPARVSALAGAPRTSWYEPDLSPRAFETALEAEADDDAAPLPARMQALLVLASLDYSYRRYDDALAKYALLERYHAATGNKTLLALVLNGTGEVHARRGQPELARQRFEAAIDPAIEGEAHAVLLNIALNLANLHMAAGRWAEAGEHYEGAAAVATALVNAPIKILCLENRGYCALQGGERADAARWWQQAATLAHGVGAITALRAVLTRLRALFADAGLRREMHDIDAELAALPANDEAAVASMPREAH